ncbi:MAG: hypothetical protein RL685_6468 [Pseudomonadota bacterium]|jgi:hypothetical protein
MQRLNYLPESEVSLSEAALSQATLSEATLPEATLARAARKRCGNKASGNLCMEGQSRGLRVGVVAFSLSLALAIAFAKADAPVALRWLLALPFFVAVVGVSESLLQTCPFLALKSLRSPSGESIEPVADPRERAALRARGQRLLLASVVIALTAAGLFAELPL